ncbi:glutathione S-transferase N-terminal domain-containing protein [Pseudochelatococcus sp. B33]
MIEFYFWMSANAYKVAMFLEETGLPYRGIPVDVSRGQQYGEEFSRIAPNNKIPLIVDTAPADGGEPITIFESGAILWYLAEKQNAFLPSDARGRIAAQQWLFWQVGGLGPMGGQAIHFRNFAPVQIDYAITRYQTEVIRLVGVLDKQLASTGYVLDDYSIVDMACYPWIVAHLRREQLDLTPYKNVLDWKNRIAERPRTQQAYVNVSKVIEGPLPKSFSDYSEDARRILFGNHAVP